MPGHRGHCRVRLVEEFRRPGGGVTASSGHGQAVDKQPGQRQRDGQQQPGPQPGGKKNPHANVLPHSDVSHHRHGATRSAALQSPARTLVLQGAVDTVVDPRNGKLLASRIPGAQLVIFPELGHLLFWQEPDSFADVVTLFLLAGGKINKSAPAAVPGTIGRGRPVGGAPPP
jgi:pimeloyl-ACP methyl ester carboxylesterase